MSDFKQKVLGLEQTETQRSPTIRTTAYLCRPP